MVLLYWQAKQALSGEMDGKLHIAMHAHMWHMTEIHNLERARKILQTRLKENGHLGKHTMDVLDLSMMKKMPAGSMANGKKPGSTHSLVI